MIKLTPFDLQVLNLVALTTSEVALHVDRFFHPELGAFSRRWFPIPHMQQVHPPKRQMAKSVRKLSLRGGVELLRWHRELLRSPAPKKCDLGADGHVYKRLPEWGSMKSASAATMAAGMVGSNQILSQQQVAAMAQRTYTEALQAQQAGLNQPSLPSNAVLHGHKIQDLLAHGFQSKDITEAIHAARGLETARGEAVLDAIARMPKPS